MDRNLIIFGVAVAFILIIAGLDARYRKRTGRSGRGGGTDDGSYNYTASSTGMNTTDASYGNCDVSDGGDTGGGDCGGGSDGGGGD